MKLIDYSPNDENLFMVANGMKNLEIIQDEQQLIYTTEGTQNFDNLNHVSFSHDSKHIVYIHQQEFRHILNVAPFENNILGHPTMTFYTDDTIYNAVISPNKNQVAIIFTAEDTIHSPINGEQDISAEQRHKYFVHVYDFTTGHISLIFEKHFDNKINISLSELDTLAISSFSILEDRSNSKNEFNVYDLNNGEDRILHQTTDYSIQNIQYFPESEHYQNCVLLITINNSTEETHMRIIDLETEFKEIFSKKIEGHIYSLGVTRYGQIALGTDNGLLYFTSASEEPIEQFIDKNILNISLSTSGNKIAFVSTNWEDGLDPNNMKVLIYNYVEENLIFELDSSDRHQEVLEIIDNDDEEEVWEEPEFIEDDEIVIEDPELETCVVPPTNREKLSEYGSQSCFNIMEGIDEDNIGNYLSSDTDNMIIFYKQQKQSGFFATCLTFTALKRFLKDPNSVYYSCVNGKKEDEYYLDPPEYLKIPAQNNIYVSYKDMKNKYIQRQNMIFLDFDKKVSEVISYNVSLSGDRMSGWHCGPGTSIDVYKIIF